ASRLVNVSVSSKPSGLPSVPSPPAPSSAFARKVMRGNRKADTRPEVELRRLLHRAGLRYRKNASIKLSGLVVTPDVVIRRRRLAIFVDGCFWHGCPEHFKLPKTNT